MNATKLCVILLIVLTFSVAYGQKNKEQLPEEQEEYKIVSNLSCNPHAPYLLRWKTVHVSKDGTKGPEVEFTVDFQTATMKVGNEIRGFKLDEAAEWGEVFTTYCHTQLRIYTYANVSEEWWDEGKGYPMKPGQKHPEEKKSSPPAPPQKAGVSVTKQNS